MNTHHLSLGFFMEKADTLDTLEAVLAIVRRGGVGLTRLHVLSHAQVDVARLELHAADDDRLDLCMARLANLIGVHDLQQEQALAA